MSPSSSSSSPCPRLTSLPPLPLSPPSLPSALPSCLPFFSLFLLISSFLHLFHIYLRNIFHEPGIRINTRVAVVKKQLKSGRGDKQQPSKGPNAQGGIAQVAAVLSCRADWRPRREGLAKEVPWGGNTWAESWDMRRKQSGNSAEGHSRQREQQQVHRTS